MLKQYLELKFKTVIVPNSLQEKNFGGVVTLAGVPVSALDIEFKALKLAGTIQGFTIGGALDGSGDPVKGVYQITWWNPSQGNSNRNNNNNSNKKGKRP